MHRILFEMLSIRSYSLKDTRTVMNDILKDDFDVEFMLNFCWQNEEKMESPLL